MPKVIMDEWMKFPFQYFLYNACVEKKACKKLTEIYSKKRFQNFKKFNRILQHFHFSLTVNITHFLSAGCYQLIHTVILYVFDTRCVIDVN